MLFFFSYLQKDMLCYWLEAPWNYQKKNVNIFSQKIGLYRDMTKKY